MWMGLVNQHSYPGASPCTKNGDLFVVSCEYHGYNDIQWEDRGVWHEIESCKAPRCCGLNWCNSLWVTKVFATPLMTATILRFVDKPKSWDIMDTKDQLMKLDMIWVMFGCKSYWSCGSRVPSYVIIWWFRVAKFLVIRQLVTIGGTTLNLPKFIGKEVSTPTKK